MKLVLKALTLAVFTFLLAGQFGAQAQGGGGFMANRVMGAVTTVDTTGNTITVQGRGQNATATTVKVNSDTKYTHPVPAAITDIAVGSPITVRSATPPQPGDTTADATSITVLDALPPAPPAGAPAGGFGGRGGRGGTTGTVVTLTPSLTIKTAAGATITITTSATTTYSQIKSATLSDIAVGNNVMITTTTDASGNVTAKTVAVQPARQRRQGGGGGGNGGGGGGNGGGGGGGGAAGA